MPSHVKSSRNRAIPKAASDNDDESIVGLRGYRVANPTRYAERRNAILEAAARVFTARSYWASTMEDIAQEMGVSKGVLYYQFRSKEEVYVEIVSRAISTALQRLNATRAKPLPAVDRLREAVHDLIAYNLDEATPNHMAMLLVPNRNALSPEARAPMRELSREYAHAMQALVQEAIDEGSILPYTAFVVAANLVTAANGVSQWFVSGRSLGAQQVADEVTAQLIGGLLPPAAEDCADGPAA